MPTGYTAGIAKGITFQQYAWNCARAFGALIMMRDDATDAPIPERFEPSDYHIKAISSARERLAALDAMSAEESSDAASAAYLAAVRYRAERISEAAELGNKYNAMLAEVVKWQPPTEDHVKYKEFMIEQLRSGINFDCNTEYYTEPKCQSGAQWLAEEISKARRDVIYHTAEHAKELERTESRNGWIKALRDSL